MIEGCSHLLLLLKINQKPKRNVKIRDTNSIFDKVRKLLKPQTQTLLFSDKETGLSLDHMMVRPNSPQLLFPVLPHPTPAHTPSHTNTHSHHTISRTTHTPSIYTHTCSHTQIYHMLTHINTYQTHYTSTQEHTQLPISFFASHS